MLVSIWLGLTCDSASAYQCGLLSAEFLARLHNIVHIIDTLNNTILALVAEFPFLVETPPRLQDIMPCKFSFLEAS